MFNKWLLQLRVIITEYNNQMDLHGVVNTRLTERMEMWSDLISDCENKLTVADLTREIWEEGPSKVVVSA